MTSIRFKQAVSFGTDRETFVLAPRAHHTSTIVGSFMYIIGGTSGKSFFSDVRVVDLRSSGGSHDWSIPRLITTMGTGEFQDVPMRGDITKPFEGRSRHTAVVVKNPKGGSSIYVFGGVHGKNKMFSLSLGAVLEWNRIESDGDGPGDLFSHCATSIQTKIYLFGGLDQSSTCSNALYKYDTLLSHWDKIKFPANLLQKYPLPPPNPYYKIHALGEYLILIGNEKIKKKVTKMTIHILNVRAGIECKWRSLNISNKILLDDMFETIALYDNNDLV